MFVQTNIKRTRSHHNIPARFREKQKPINCQQLSGSSYSLKGSSTCNLNQGSLKETKLVSNNIQRTIPKNLFKPEVNSSNVIFAKQQITPKHIKRLDVGKTIKENPEKEPLKVSQIHNQSGKDNKYRKSSLNEQQSRRRSLYKREFSFDQDREHDASCQSLASKCGNKEGSIGECLAENRFENEKRSLSLTVESLREHPISVREEDEIDTSISSKLGIEKRQIVLEPQDSRLVDRLRNFPRLKYLLSWTLSIFQQSRWKTKERLISLLGEKRQLNKLKEGQKSQANNESKIRKTKFAILGSFCTNFVSYQLKTWHLLFDDLTHQQIDHQFNMFTEINFPEANLYTSYGLPHHNHTHEHDQPVSLYDRALNQSLHTYHNNNNNNILQTNNNYTYQTPTDRHQQMQMPKMSPVVQSRLLLSSVSSSLERQSVDASKYVHHQAHHHHHHHHSHQDQHNNYSYPRSRGTLESQRSLYDWDNSAAESSLKEDALNQFIMNISMDPMEMEMVNSNNSRNNFGLSNERPVLRQMSATDVEDDFLWMEQASNSQLQFNHNHYNQYLEPFSYQNRSINTTNYDHKCNHNNLELKSSSAKVRRNRQLMDKRYSNSWDCNKSTEIPTDVMERTEMRRQIAINGQQQVTISDKEASGKIQLAQVFNTSSSSNQLDYSKQISNKQLLLNVHSKSDQTRSCDLIPTVPKQKDESFHAVGNTLEEDNNKDGLIKNNSSKLSQGSNYKLRPSSQNSNASSSGNRKLGGGISPSKLVSLVGAKKRLGFKQRAGGLSSLSVQRSEEIVPYEAARQLIRELTVNSISDSGNESGSGNNTSYSHWSVTDPRTRFVEGLGSGQVVSRQALVSPYLGDIQLALSDRRDLLEVEVVRARHLQIKAGAKMLPSPYVKIYLMKGKKCLAKCKTTTARKTLNPLYQQQFIIREDYTGCVLQVIVWADYGTKDPKSLMGIVQVHLSDLDISKMVVGWYRLFNAPSMACSIQLQSSKNLRHSVLTFKHQNSHQILSDKNN